eukprot:c19147_g3_i2.p1 GENE.c19147_g3_i2~~c19147_g3_i2.p1  ORF type:complete len:669 (+),score=157.33 c19147_g3_i2:288-2009(+)
MDQMADRDLFVMRQLELMDSEIKALRFAFQNRSDAPLGNREKRPVDERPVDDGFGSMSSLATQSVIEIQLRPLVLRLSAVEADLNSMGRQLPKDHLNAHSHISRQLTEVAKRLERVMKLLDKRSGGKRREGESPPSIATPPHEAAQYTNKQTIVTRQNTGQQNTANNNSTNANTNTNITNTNNTPETSEGSESDRSVTPSDLPEDSSSRDLEDFERPIQVNDDGENGSNHLEGSFALPAARKVPVDMAHLVTGVSDGSVRVWDCVSKNVLTRMDEHSMAVSNLAVSPIDSRKIASSSEDHGVCVFHADTGVIVNTLSGHGNKVLSIALSPNDTHALCGCDDGNLRLYDLNTDKMVLKFKGHRGAVFGCVMNATGDRAYSASEDSHIRVWDVATGESVGRFKDDSGPVYGIAATANPRHIIACSAAGVRVWDLNSGLIVQTFSPHNSNSNPNNNNNNNQQQQVEAGKTLTCAVSTDGHFIVAGGEDKLVRLWDTRTATTNHQTVNSNSNGGLCRIFHGHAAEVSSVAFSPCGSFVASASADFTARIWDVNTGYCVRNLPHESAVTCCVFAGRFD